MQLFFHWFWNGKMGDRSANFWWFLSRGLQQICTTAVENEVLMMLSSCWADEMFWEVVQRKDHADRLKVWQSEPIWWRHWDRPFQTQRVYNSTRGWEPSKGTAPQQWRGVSTQTAKYCPEPSASHPPQCLLLMSFLTTLATPARIIDESCRDRLKLEIWLQDCENTNQFQTCTH